MRILGLEKLSLVDYPNGLCAVVFTGGCNFYCPFCHNSGLVRSEVEELSYDEVMSYLNSRSKMLDAVCVSGGEPTLYHDLPQFIKELKNIGYKVKLDTNGTNPTMLRELIEANLLDYVAMDIKNAFEEYSAITGVKVIDTSLIKESIEILEKSKVAHEFRTTLVKEFHTPTAINAMAKDLKGVSKLYLQRFVDTETCIAGGLSEVDRDTAEEYANILRTSIKEVSLRGYV